MKRFVFDGLKLCLLLVLLLASLPVSAQRKARHKSIDMKKALTVLPQTMPVSVKDETFEMVLVQGGVFMMGCEPRFWNNVGRKDEVPRHAVGVRSFYLGCFEVTQRLWKAVMGYNPSNFVGDDLPVEQVSYAEVMLFIEKLNQLTGKKFRLPTEAEWEYAARGGMLSEGHPYSGSDKVTDVGWMCDNSDGTTHPVGELTANELGLYDMTGNVWEWCSDWYNGYTYFMDGAASSLDIPDDVKGINGVLDWMKSNGHETDLLESTVETDNPRGMDTGDCRVGRGGSWTDRTGGENGLRIAYRNFWPPEKKLSVLGFRLALSEEDVPVGGWMPSQYVVDSSDGKYYAVSPESMIRASQGVLDGLFSIGEGKRVRFSRGNLQYNAVRDEWRFADRQFDVIGEDNIKNDEHYAGWIDLFAWGCSGYNRRPPYFFAMVNTAYGNGKRNIDGTHYDWGLHNAISNGGKEAGLWRTMSVNEWAYLLMRRADAYYLAYPASINDRKGMVLLPDNWFADGGDTVNPNVPHLYSVLEWRQLERAGAVFLPCAGYQKLSTYHYGYPIGGEPQIELLTVGFGIVPPETKEPVSAMAKSAGEEDPYESVFARESAMRAAYREPNEGGALGYYWTTIHHEKDYAMGFAFYYGSRGFVLPFERLTRMSVRLVQEE